MPDPKPDADPRKGPCLDCHDHCRIVEQFEAMLEANHSLHSWVVQLEQTVRSWRTP